MTAIRWTMRKKPNEVASGFMRIDALEGSGAASQLGQHCRFAA
jgi:hypothetical protein